MIKEKTFCGTKCYCPDCHNGSMPERLCYYCREEMWKHPIEEEKQECKCGGKNGEHVEEFGQHSPKQKERKPIGWECAKHGKECEGVNCGEGVRAIYEREARVELPEYVELPEEMDETVDQFWSMDVDRKANVLRTKVDRIIQYLKQNKK